MVASTPLDQLSQLQQHATREIELKLEVDPQSVSAILEGPLPDAAECRSQDQLTVYYDTPENSLKQRGFTLRVRSIGDRFVQTIKPVTDSACLVSRTEIEHDVASIEPDLSRLDGTPLEALVHSGKLDRLLPLIRSEVRRTSWVAEVGGSSMQIDFDQGEMTAGGHSQRFDELELELLSGEPSCLLAAAKMVADRAPVRIGVMSKAERGDRLAAGVLQENHQGRCRSTSIAR